MGIYSPKNCTTKEVRNIALCSFYVKPNSHKKSQFLDHISEAYNLISAKFGNDVNFIIAGDGPKRILLEEMIERHRLQHRVEMLGELQQNQVIDQTFVANLQRTV